MRLARAAPLGRGALEEPPTVPAGDQRQPVAIEDRAERGALARKLVAELDAGITRLLRLGEAGLQRRLPTELREVVVGPRDGVDADADGHAAYLGKCARLSLWSRRNAYVLGAAAVYRRLRPRRRPHRLEPAASLSQALRGRGRDGEVPRHGLHARMERAAGCRTKLLRGGGAPVRAPPAPRRADRGLWCPLQRDDEGADRGQRGYPQDLARAWCAALRAQQLVERDLSDGAAPLRFLKAVPRHGHFRRSRRDQARSADFSDPAGTAPDRARRGRLYRR